MCVVAHPDDECFGFGGCLALASRRGVETYVVCLTDGQAATHRGEASSGAALGAMRRDEFRLSCGVLGVTEEELLEFQDGQMEHVNFPEAAGCLVGRMRRFQPDVVVTFGPEGGLNTHPDHMMVSMLTTAAFHWSGRAKRYPEAGRAFQPRRLFYLSTSFFLPGRQPPLSCPWTVTLNIEDVRHLKQEAFRQHRSQAPLMEKTRTLFEKYGAQEFYTLAAAPEPQAARLSSDLFAGL